jgi:hypothetical protein
MSAALFVAAAIANPFLMLRGRALRRFFAVAMGGVLVFAFLALAARPLQIEVDPYLAFVTLGVLIVAACWAFVALSPAEDVRWSATRAALAAGVLYLAIIPLMLRTPIDGDEPYYVLITESMVRDHDLDLANQYRDLAHSATGRTDLTPQLGDPVGPRGELYSRHEPFLPLLLIPGYLLGGLGGAIATIAIFGALLARSTVRFLEDEGIDDATARALFPLIALGPPIVFYSARIWPEVPAAFFLVEAVRGLRQRRPARWVPSLFALVLLKLRFLLIAIALLARALRSRTHAAIAAAIIGIPLLLALLISGSATNVHALRELIPGTPSTMVRGLFGLMLDGTAGILFQAPVYVLSLFALVHWRSMPAGFRYGMSAALLYLIYLVPRSEWHGGWSPPLRYIVVLMPILALGCAAMWQRVSASTIAVIAAWTIVLVVHGLTYPWRLFHIANGENFVGETLSTIWHSDFSRLFPSFIRVNLAAYVASALLIATLGLSVWRRRSRLRLPALSVMIVLLALAFFFGRRPAARIEFEDAHVIHRGGELYPQEFQVQRFMFRGGWILHAGDSVSVRALGGPSRLQYGSAQPVILQIGTQAYALPPTGNRTETARVEIARDGRTEFRCLSGTIFLDRMDHE